MAIEIGGFSHEKWWFSIAMLVYQRVILLPSGQQDDVPRQAPLGHWLLWKRSSALVSQPNPYGPSMHTVCCIHLILIHQTRVIALLSHESVLSQTTQHVYTNHIHAHTIVRMMLSYVYMFLGFSWHMYGTAHCTSSQLFFSTSAGNPNIWRDFPITLW